MNKSVILSLIVIIALVGVGYLAFKSLNSPEPVVVNSFDECASAGYPIMESFPRQCRTPEGELFVESVADGSEPQVAGATASGGCFIGGCSSQICSDDPDAVSTCEFREEYACYKTGRCERQAGGQCGWTETPELAICLNAILNPGADLK
jgi:hypothetical protein